jgi:formate dehydrogenase major subunit/NADH-quinone oxidoreductase subunit G
MNKKNLTISIDGKIISAEEGARLLWVALDNGIYIPNLCILRGMEIPPAACRLCLVEVNGKPDPVTACTEQVYEGMRVRTATPTVLRLRCTAAELLIASHPANCPSCGKNRSCQLQSLAKILKLKLKPDRLRPLLQELPIDRSHSALLFDPNKCLLCGRCVWVCKERSGLGILQFTHRGFETRVSTFMNKPLTETRCTGCLECVRVCPVGALLVRE